MVADINNLLAGVVSSSLNPQGAVPASIGGGSVTGGSAHGRGVDDDSAYVYGAALLALTGVGVVASILSRERPQRSGGPGPDLPGDDPYKDKSDADRLKEAGKLRIEGKDYVMQDGDVVEFRHGAGR